MQPGPDMDFIMSLFRQAEGATGKDVKKARAAYMDKHKPNSPQRWIFGSYKNKDGFGKSGFLYTNTKRFDQHILHDPREYRFLY